MKTDLPLEKGKRTEPGIIRNKRILAFVRPVSLLLPIHSVS